MKMNEWMMIVKNIRKVFFVLFCFVSDSHNVCGSSKKNFFLFFFSLSLSWMAILFFSFIWSSSSSSSTNIQCNVYVYGESSSTNQSINQYCLFVVVVIIVYPFRTDGLIFIDNISSYNSEKNKQTFAYTHIAFFYSWGKLISFPEHIND